ncbi:MAG: NTPase [Thermoleophilaceae bacterium]|nr:NTPase [Thermoleophilaceae bacterium]
MLEARPGAGKTTAAVRLAERLRTAGVPLAGFVTEEMRERGVRVGFRIETFAGERGVLAHVDLPGPPRVGKYGVDLEAFERVALPALEQPAGGAAVIDELGKMELSSGRFREAVGSLLEARVPVIATVHAFRHPFTDGLKQRSGVELIRLSRANRDELPGMLAERLGA